MNPYNWRADYGNSNWDIRHRMVSSFVYSLPALQKSHAAIKAVLGGWQANGIVTFQSGIPFNVSIATDRANTSSQGTQRPDVIGIAQSTCGSGNLVGCIDSSAFTMPALYTYGNAGRNLLKGPSLFANDFSLFKNFPMKERLSLQFRAEFFNLFNSPQFSNPASVFGTAAFGSISTTSIDNRIMQFGLKLAF